MSDNTVFVALVAAIVVCVVAGQSGASVFFGILLVMTML